MCWCWPSFGNSANSSKKRSKPKRTDKTSEKRSSDTSFPEVVVVTVTQPDSHAPREKRRHRETSKPSEKPKARESQSQRLQGNSRPRESRGAGGTNRRRGNSTIRESQRPSLQVDVPNRWYRTVEAASSLDNSSTEMLLNPRPERSRHHRQRHPTRNSTSTLRGRGAKRDPPSRSKSKKHSDKETKGHKYAQLSSPPKTPPRRERAQHQQPSPRHHQSRQSHSRTPNTTARRIPDRRFAVLAATNQALEDIRREAFTYPSPPPRRGRVQQYQGIPVETSTIPFHWDCISNSYQPTVSQASQGSSSGHRRRSRR
ncbi:hypothetical protein K432DRAFT_415949 [Lepidopterella palustris CBS 459.81]|uniref:Uncharacterized protein n=1 Tax=Lepidopterella palustris CBS 459.81 TaxID=1314670 RepID=A0A8E2ED70_9PEZI|nr:hypothetical protein K432DRAFT_415949 [Lepidopterella palustris CBS 459.81]